MPYLYIMILGLRFGKIFIVGLHRVVAVSVILVVGFFRPISACARTFY